MFTTAFACVPTAALSGERVRGTMANPAVITDATTWYVPAMGARSGFGHKHPSRRPPSPT